jgi:hypothetical protein
MRFITSIFLTIIIVPLSFFCKTERKEIPLLLNIAIRDSLMRKYGDNIAILSCLRCECFVQYFNYFNTGINRFVLLTDTNCNKLKIPAIYIPNTEIEKLSDGIYNLTLIKNDRGRIKTKILDAGDSSHISEGIKSFFR